MSKFIEVTENGKAIHISIPAILFFEKSRDVDRNAKIVGINGSIFYVQETAAQIHELIKAAE